MSQSMHTLAFKMALLSQRQDINGSIAFLNHKRQDKDVRQKVLHILVKAHLV